MALVDKEKAKMKKKLAKSLQPANFQTSEERIKELEELMQKYDLQPNGKTVEE